MEILPCFNFKCDFVFYFIYIYILIKGLSLLSHVFFNDILKIVLNVWYRIFKATRAARSKILVNIFPCFPFGNIPLSKILTTFFLPLRSINAFLRIKGFFSSSDQFFWFCRFFEIINMICLSYLLLKYII